MAIQFSGLYRARVVDDRDPIGKGRLFVSVLPGSAPGSWALPCVPYSSGKSVTTPPVGETIWVMFERGDPMYPVWIGWYPS